MKIGGCRLGGGLSGGVKRLGSRLARVRYFRGHGVHSPFVYDLVREVFMRRELLPGGHALYEALLAAGVSRRRAVELQNLALHCGYVDFGLNRADADLCVVAGELPEEQLRELVRAAQLRGGTVVLLAPRAAGERAALWRTVVQAHPSTSVDKRAYLLLFNNGLPKQHFRI